MQTYKVSVSSPLSFFTGLNCVGYNGSTFGNSCSKFLRSACTCSGGGASTGSLLIPTTSFCSSSFSPLCRWVWILTRIRIWATTYDLHSIKIWNQEPINTNWKSSHNEYCERARKREREGKSTYCGDSSLRLRWRWLQRQRRQWQWLWLQHCSWSRRLMMLLLQHRRQWSCSSNWLNHIAYVGMRTRSNWHADAGAGDDPLTGSFLLHHLHQSLIYLRQHVGRQVLFFPLILLHLPIRNVLSLNIAMIWWWWWWWWW